MRIGDNKNGRERQRPISVGEEEEEEVVMGF